MSTDKLVLPEETGVATDLIQGQRGDDVWVGTSRGFLLHYQWTSLSGAIEMGRWQVCKTSIRRILLLEEGRRLLVANSKGNLRVLEVATLSTVKRIRYKGTTTTIGIISAMQVASQSSNGWELILGTDEGELHMGKLSMDGWKFQVKTTLKHHEDYISAITVVPMKKIAFVASGDGQMSVIDMRKAKVAAMTENFEEEMTAIKILPHTRMPLLASGCGTIRAFKWGYWGLPCVSLAASHHQHAAINDIALFQREGHTFALTADSEGFLRVINPNCLEKKQIANLYHIDDSLERFVVLEGMPEDAICTVIAMLPDDRTLPAIVISAEMLNQLFKRPSKRKRARKYEEDSDEEEEEEEEGESNDDEHTSQDCDQDDIADEKIEMIGSSLDMEIAPSSGHRKKTRPSQSSAHNPQQQERFPGLD